MTLRVAIVHDYLTQRGGAERVVLSLHRLFPAAPVYTSLYDPDGTYPEFADVDVRPSALQRLPHRGPAFRALLPLYPGVFGRLRLRGHDLVISSSSAFAHGVRIEGGHHLCYCHTPPRFLHRTDQYLAEGSAAPSWSRPALAPVLAGLRRWDLAAARRPDSYVANSHAVAARIEAAYGRVAPVVFPPVDPARPTEALPGGGRPYFLAVSRLLTYKRVDLAVRACTARGSRLVVVGDGPTLPALREVAGPDVEFRGTVGDAELAALLRGCTALIQAGEEDFGMVPLEANAAGRPVVAFAGGGALDTVVDGVSGLVFHEQSVDALADALDLVEAEAWDADKLVAHARSFSEARFHDELRARLADLGVAPVVARQE